jgi:hypothetical protein
VLSLCTCFQLIAAHGAGLCWLPLCVLLRMAAGTLEHCHTQVAATTARGWVQQNSRACEAPQGAGCSMGAGVQRALQWQEGSAADMGDSNTLRKEQQQQQHAQVQQAAP